MINCPHCFTRVLPTEDNICPACRQYVVEFDRLTPSQQQNAIRNLHKTAINELASGKKQDEVIKQLTHQGWSESISKQIVVSDQKAITDYLKSPKVRAKVSAIKARNRMLAGLSLMITGGCITLVTYELAKVNHGGVYYVFGGVIFIGLINFFFGFIDWLASK